MSRSSGTEAAGLPKTFVLELTRHCNHRCGHCYGFWDSTSETPGMQPNGGSQMTAAELDELVARLQDETPLESIALSGGEPTLRADLPEIVQSLQRRGISPVLITNGTRLSREAIDRLTGVAAFELTLFSFRPEVHDALAGRRGAWEAAISAMANLKRAGRQWVAVFVATRRNCEDLEDTAKLAIALGAYGMMYNRMNFGSKNLDRVADLAPPPEMIQANLKTLDALAQRYGLAIAASVVIEPCVVDVSPYSNVHFGWCPLAGEDAYFTVSPAGDVRICNHSPVTLGNIRKGGFGQIFRHHPHVEAFRETWPEECAGCEPRLKNMCRGGCKAAAEQCYGTLARIDPFVTWCRERRKVAAPTA